MKFKMRKQHSETIAENDNGDWIEVTYNKRGEPEFYILFFSNNGVTLNVCPEVFKSYKELFWQLTKDLEAETHEEY